MPPSAPRQKHTPGPWTIGKDTEWSEMDTRPNSVIVELKNTCCMVLSDTDQGDDNHDIDEQCRANARLISAAPDMFEALEEIRFWSQNFSAVIPDTIAMTARAALDKVAGRKGE